ncbi:histidinol-phosphate transaminase [Chryseobacterium sp. HSC-36S06]|uniref:histidinol-phosphate transaminase n=1 Tax=Chryseobacterium sp. HSC-36S06 TaxID=2910970 RepID=UPI00209DA6EB|nr:histidinol-phosphate transaminase [Chryseobacterium sp. HSC-36S06]MCP2038736.1 histidinol-phosphate aminotransferase [Chryseobacterium sp. HSC-36S06]
MKSKVQQFVRKNIQALAPYSSARDEYSGKEGIFLDANENPFGVYNRYPDPYQPALKEKLAQIKNTSADQIFIGNGSDEAIDLAFRIFCEPGQDKALTFVPTYGMYEVSANINDVELIKLPLNEEFQIDRNLLQPFFSDKNLKLIFICSPNNPTGNLLRTGDIEFILKNFNGIVLIDEAYIDFCDQPSFIKKISEYPNLIVIQTLSKAWGLAGIRLGIGYMNEEILSYFNRVKAPYNISTVNQQTALDILNKEQDYRQKVKDILAEKEQLIQNLTCVKGILTIYPSDANFLLVEVENADELYEKLIARKIIIRNRNSVIKNCVRISVGTSGENEQLLNALKEFSND